MYGTMFTNHFSGRHKPLECQAKDLVVDVLFFGLLSDTERAAWMEREPAAGNGDACVAQITGRAGGAHGNSTHDGSSHDGEESHVGK